MFRNQTFADITSLGNKHGNIPAVAVAGAGEDAVLGAVASGLAAGVGFFLVGCKTRIQSIARRHHTSLDNAVVIDTGDADEMEICRTAASLCVQGKAGILMKGLVGTASFTKAILARETGLTDPGALLSHAGLFDYPGNGKIFLITDAAINILPDIEAKKKILANIVDTARALGIAIPKIALLAPVEKVSQKIQSTVDSAELKVWLKGGALGQVVADGPFALDVAASDSAARIKGLQSPVAGQVDIYLLPNLDAGNIFYKTLTVFLKASSAGIVLGARVPVVLTSRSDTLEVKVASLGLALQTASAKF